MSRDWCERWAAAMEEHLRGPAGLYRIMPPADTGIVANQLITFEDAPDREAIELAGIPEGYVLVGLWRGPMEWGGGWVQIFEQGCVGANIHPLDALHHELSHALGRDHPPVALTALPHAGSSAATPPAWEVEAGWPRAYTDDCPACQVSARAGEARNLLEALRIRAMMAFEIPPGWGGVIPLARYRLHQAEELAREVGPTLRPEDRWTAMRALDKIAEAQAALRGWLRVEDLPRAADAAYVAWDATTDITGAWWQARALGSAAAA